MNAPGPRRFARDLGRALSWHRRKLAVVAVVAAVITGISAARPPDPPTTTVVRTTHELPAGATLADGDVRVDHVPVSAAPARIVQDRAVAVGAAARAPLAAGQMITELDLGSPRAGRVGQVVAPLRLSDADLASLVRIGDRVDVIAAPDAQSRPKVVASGALVVGLPKPGDDGLADSASPGSLLLVEVDLRTATALAETGSGGRLSIVLR